MKPFNKKPSAATTADVHLQLGKGKTRPGASVRSLQRHMKRLAHRRVAQKALDAYKQHLADQTTL